MEPDELRQAFLAYVAGLIADFERYLSSGKPDRPRDGASMYVAALWLTDSELMDFLRDLAAIAQPRLANAPNPGRRRRLLYTVFLPWPTDGGSQGASRTPRNPVK